MSRHRSPGWPRAVPTASRIIASPRGAHRAAGSDPRGRILAAALAVGTVTTAGTGVASAASGEAPTAAPTVPTTAGAAPTSEQPSGLLQRGSNGAAVQQLQRVLNAWYPAMTPLADDGRFGPDTESRVRYLQERAGIAVDGVVGPETNGVLGMRSGNQQTSDATDAESTDADDADADADDADADDADDADADADEPSSSGSVVTPTNGRLTSGFGARWGTNHNGIDIANSIGTPIVSTTDGVIAESGPASGFGMWVRVLHSDGTIAVYGHINESLVSEGQRVRAGEEIATIGNRGQSTGPHLHFEIWEPDGRKVDPAGWLSRHGVSV